MDFSLSTTFEYVLTIIVAIFVLFAFVHFLTLTSNAASTHSEDEKNQTMYVNDSTSSSRPVITAIDNITVDDNNESLYIINETTNEKTIDEDAIKNYLKNYASATDYNGNDISDSITVDTNINIAKHGIYDVRYTVTDDNGVSNQIIVSVIVN